MMIHTMTEPVFSSVVIWLVGAQSKNETAFLQLVFPIEITDSSIPSSSSSSTLFG